MNEDTDQGIFSRKMVFCPFLRDRFNFPDDILVHCPECLRFVAVCCSDYKAGKRCHHWQLVYTDGACLSNGQKGATAGIGVAIGLGDLGLHQWSIPIDDTVDAYPTRSSQRAELLAAIEGLRLISEANAERLDDHTTPRGAKKPFAIVITTDSEYVVKGMTEWFPTWKVRARSCRKCRWLTENRRTDGAKALGNGQEIWICSRSWTLK